MDAEFYRRYLDGRADLNGREIQRNPDAVARMRDDVLSTGYPTYIGRLSSMLTGSHFGGHPDLPAGCAWPQSEGNDLLFVAQIDLADLPPDDRPQWMPHSGKLLFFMGQEENLVPGASQVMYVAENQNLRPAGETAAARQYLIFERRMTYKLPPTQELGHPDDANELRDWWENLIPSRHSIRWQIDGWPLPLQSHYDMQHECERIYRGLTADDAEAQYKPDFQEAKQSWRLLGQFESLAIMEQPAGCMRGFFWVKVENGQALFDKVWLIGQSD